MVNFGVRREVTDYDLPTLPRAAIGVFEAMVAEGLARDAVWVVQRPDGENTAGSSHRSCRPVMQQKMREYDVYCRSAVHLLSGRSPRRAACSTMVRV